MEFNNNLKSQLENQLWSTRKCRINAESRLLSNLMFLNTVNIFYSIFVSAISIVSLIYSNKGFALVSVVLSISLTIFITFSSSLNYKERAEKMKKNYIDINDLLVELKGVACDDVEEIERINHYYNDLLRNVENHKEYDYYRFVIENNTENNSCGIKINYYFHTLIRWVLQALAFVVPIVLTIIVACY